MDFYQLKTFYTVARYKNFSRAAEELSISQPAVSRQIESLEKSLGVTLLYRVKKITELTEAGRILYDHAEQVLMMVEKTKVAIEGFRNLEYGSLVVGASTTIGNYCIAPVVLEFMEKYPGIQIRLEIKPSTEIQERMTKKLLDIAILPDVVPSSYSIQDHLLRDELVLVLPKNSKFVKQEHVQIHDLLDETFLIRDLGSNTRRTIEGHLKKCGVNLRRVVELGSNESIKQAVIAGGGVSFLSKRTVQYELALGVIDLIEGTDFQTSRDFYIVYHEDSYPSPVVRTFVDFLQDHNQ